MREAVTKRLEPNLATTTEAAMENAAMGSAITNAMYPASAIYDNLLFGFILGGALHYELTGPKYPIGVIFTFN